MSFLQRKIDVTFQLGTGDFGEMGYNTVSCTGHRVQCEVTRGALPGLSTAAVRIYGIPPAVMNQLSTLGGNPYVTGRRNIMTVSAGDDVFGMSAIFEGVITNGYQDYELPDAAFVAEAGAGQLDAMKPADATSYRGSVDVATVLEGMAKRMTPPLTFDNFGVSVMLTNPYFSGTLLDQIRSAMHAANIVGEIHNGSLAIWPRNGWRPVAPVTLSPETGLVGYPNINGYQIIGCRALFNPAIDFGQILDLKSSLQAASGEWYCGGLHHELQSQTPDGAWFSEFELWSKTYVKSLPQY